MERLADETRNRIEMHNGLPILVKKIPDVDEPGVADPSWKRQTEAQRANPKKIENPDPSEFMGIPYGMIRQMMGADNLDVTTIPIQTEEFRIPTRVGDVRVRLYRPENGTETPKPCMVYFHGGGFIGGTIEVVENSCKLLAEAADAVVLNVDYRLAPETPYPGGLRDCYDAVAFAWQHAQELGIDRSKICVGGDSAGGNLAAVCALMDRDRGNHYIAYEALIYPTVLRTVKGYEHIIPWSLDRYEIKDDRELLEGASSAIMKGDEAIGVLYTGGRDDRLFNPYVSPYCAEDLSGICKTTIFNAEYDSLRLQGEEYGRKLMQAGVDVRLVRYRGVGHAYVDMCGIFPQDEDRFREIGKDMRSL